MKLKDILIKHEDGSYEPKTPISISKPDGNVVTIGPGVKLQPGVEFFGINISELLERDVPITSFGSDSTSGTITEKEKKSSN